VYGTPGFCFAGSIIGKLESLHYYYNNSNSNNDNDNDSRHKFTDDEMNRMCRAPLPPPPPPPPPPENKNDVLGPSGGSVAALTPDHSWIQRLLNLKQWLQIPELRDWLVQHRLFNLNHYDTAKDVEYMVNETYQILLKYGLVIDNRC